MKKVLTILMLTFSLAAFSQNETKIIVLDFFNKSININRSTLADLKANLAQAISETDGFEGVVNKKVDDKLIAEGFSEHPRLSENQTKQIASLSGVQYALMSEVSCDDWGKLTAKTVLIDLEAYKIMGSEAVSMNNTHDKIQKGCETLSRKIITYLPKPEVVIVKKTEEPIAEPTLPKPQKLTGREVEDVTRLVNRADVCIEMNYLDEAIKEYDKIVEIAPGWADVYMYLADTYATKGDQASLKKAESNYKIFMQLTDNKKLYFEAKDKLSRVEMMTELRTKETENADNLVGTWRSDIHSVYTGKPWFVIDIAKTAIPNKYQITLSPKSMMYDNIVNTKAYSEFIGNTFCWSFSFQDTYIPSQSKYNIAGAAINYLFDNGSFASLVGNTLVEMERESDVGYTNIMNFDFATDFTIQDTQDEFYKKLSDKLLAGTCLMKGEHHQSGRNNVSLDTVRECNFLQGDSPYPVFVKVKEVDGKYYYGDIKLDQVNTIMDLSPYISKTEYDEYKSCITMLTVSSVFLGLSAGSLLGGLAFNGLNKTSNGASSFTFGKTYFIITGVVSSISLISFISVESQRSNILKRCYTKHNKQVDENLKYYGQEDQASVSVNIGLTPMGAGISVNF